MPEETDRIYKNKRIDLPGGGTVLFPVIARITFTDAKDRYQETQTAIDNSSAADRDVHIAWIIGDKETNNEDAPLDTPTPDGALAVERIDRWRVLDPKDRHQETFTALDNRTKDEDGPPYFTTHLKTHVLRIVNDPDDGAFIETEVIDQISVLDPSDRNQETIYNLENPEGEPDDEGNLVYHADSDDEDITDISDPVRTDPFQNIIKIGGQAVIFFEDHT